MSLDVYLKDGDDYLYSSNITHNLGKMAKAVDIYTHLWRPEEIDITKAWQLINPLLAGYSRLIYEKEDMEKLNSPNGWGMYEHFLPFVSGYIEACVMNPNASVEVSR